MVKVCFTNFAGESVEVDVPVGWSLMEGAVKNGVEGVVAECGGALACATCHVYIDADWFDRLPEKSAGEDEMLGFLEERRPNSRLSCQIKISEDMSGLRAEIPES